MATIFRKKDGAGSTVVKRMIPVGRICHVENLHSLDVTSVIDRFKVAESRHLAADVDCARRKSSEPLYRQVSVHYQRITERR